MVSLDTDVASINGSDTAAVGWAVWKVLEDLSNFSTLSEGGEVDHFGQDSQDCITHAPDDVSNTVVF